MSASLLLSCTRDTRVRWTLCQAEAVMGRVRFVNSKNKLSGTLSKAPRKGFLCPQLLCAMEYRIRNQASLPAPHATAGQASFRIRTTCHMVTMSISLVANHPRKLMDQ